MYLDEILEQSNTNSTRHKSKNGECHGELVFNKHNEIMKEQNDAVSDAVNDAVNEVLKKELKQEQFEIDAELQYEEDFKNGDLPIGIRGNWEEDKESYLLSANKIVKAKKYFETLNEIQKQIIEDLERKEMSNVGVKENKGKPQMSLLFKQFPKALQAVVKCSEFGHQKYKEVDTDYLNYTRVEGGSDKYADASLRHRMETGNDFESGLPHQFHSAWNALAELELWIQENK